MTDQVRAQGIATTAEARGSSTASAESSWIACAKQAALFALASLSLFAIVLGVMFTIVASAGIFGVLGVIAVVLMLTGASVAVQHRRVSDEGVGREYAPTA